MSADEVMPDFFLGGGHVSWSEGVEEESAGGGRRGDEGTC